MGLKELVHPILATITNPKALCVIGVHLWVSEHVPHSLDVNHQVPPFGVVMREVAECLGGVAVLLRFFDVAPIAIVFDVLAWQVGLDVHELGVSSAWVQRAVDHLQEEALQKLDFLRGFRHVVMFSQHGCQCLGFNVSVVRLIRLFRVLGILRYVARLLPILVNGDHHEALPQGTLAKGFVPDVDVHGLLMPREGLDVIRHLDDLLRHIKRDGVKHAVGGRFLGASDGRPV
mmetsp:Transcript_20964/g.37473  ORF Transcript_20964/g.37473 Transcript_20964/m.37473 type:complete len:231 (-) Transcript_20964:454-1146(-)